jgi:hypothetical protein
MIHEYIHFTGQLVKIHNPNMYNQSGSEHTLLAVSCTLYPCLIAMLVMSIYGINEFQT